MNREQRIEEAKRRAADTSVERAESRAAAEEDLRAHIEEMTPDEAATQASAINFDSSVKALGPIATPHEWDLAVAAARAVTSKRPGEARKSRTVNSVSLLMRPQG
jgi:hypothetical protein